MKKDIFLMLFFLSTSITYPMNVYKALLSVDTNKQDISSLKTIYGKTLDKNALEKKLQATTKQLQMQRTQYETELQHRNLSWFGNLKATHIKKGLVSSGLCVFSVWLGLKTKRKIKSNQNFIPIDLENGTRIALPLEPKQKRILMQSSFGLSALSGLYALYNFKQGFSYKNSLKKKIVFCDKVISQCEKLKTNF